MEKSCYPAYKDSGVPWLGNIPKQWDVVPIKFTLDIPITDGPHETPKLYSEGIPFLSAEAVKEDRLDFNKKRGFITEDEHTRFSKKYKPKKGDVYMVKSGATTGNVARVETDEEFNIWSPLAALRPNNKVITTDFIFYFMKSKPFFYSVELSWSYGTQQNIGMGVISNLKMALPPVGEQLKITEFLNSRTSQIDRLIEKKKALIEKLNEKRIALITQAVTKGLNPNVPMKPSGVDWLGDVPAHWEVRALKFCCDFLNNRRIPLSAEERVGMERNYPYYGASGIIDEVENYIFNEPTILVAEDGANLLSRSTPLAFEASGEYWVNNHAHILKPKEGPFAYWSNLLCIIQYEPWITGSAQPKLTKDNLGTIPLPRPTLDEQYLIDNYIQEQTKKIDPMLAIAKTTIERLTEYRIALITAAVTGKIDVRGIDLASQEAA